ncbi:hypothetical protein H9P43_009664 [Blastocladiella emersonii ATCC 22665]|nr:hypothetical protein H9P43_009664 [Blastocladiella emersonii ATCC 22665]
MRPVKTFFAVALVLGLALTGVAAAPSKANTEGASLERTDYRCWLNCTADCRDRCGSNKSCRTSCYQDCDTICDMGPINP